MKYILSVEGGGSRGVIASQFLKLLELDLKKRDSSIYKTFDMYSGTSTGAMIVSAIAYKKKINDDSDFPLLDSIFTLENIQKMFKKSLMDRILNVVQFKPKYKGSVKRTLINENTPEIYVYETDKKVLITGYNVSENEARFFKSYNNEKVLLRDALDVSSAAPSFFPSVKYNDNGKIKYGIDGAMFAMDPTDCAYADSLKIWPDEEIRILSIGLGTSTFNESNGPASMFWGGIQWLLKGSIIDRLMFINSKVVSYRTETFAKALGHSFLRIGDDLEYMSLDSNTKEEYDKMITLGTDLFYKEKDRVFELLNF